MKRLFTLSLLLLISAPFLWGQESCGTDIIQQLKENADSNFSRQHYVHEKLVNRFRNYQAQNEQFWHQYHLENDSSGEGGITTQGLTGGGGSGCRNVRYVIPVVVHIVHDPSHSTPGTGSNISDAQVNNQLQELNDAHANINGGPGSVNKRYSFAWLPMYREEAGYSAFFVQNMRQFSKKTCLYFHRFVLMFL